MRTTIRLNDKLLRELKQHAAKHGRTLTGVIEDALRQFLARAPGSTVVPPYRPLTFKGRLRAGVNLDDSAALLDLMEEAPAPGRR
ncbi:MAG: CopG family transcriptional regulator [Chloroflexi bacterium]|nr:MAG: CopG family transcriptional regulator [Chloroflexota bacterium]